MGIDMVLAGLLAEHARTPFAWGTFDCCQWVRRALLATSGRAVAIAPYSSERGARRVLAALGGFDGAMALAEAAPLAGPALAQRGDVVLVEVPGQHFAGALAVCTGGVAHAAAAVGLAAVPQSAWRRAWRVACRRP